MLEQQHLHFALPSAPTRGVGAAGKLRDERLAERRIRRRSFELLRLRGRYPPASRATLEELDSVGRELRAQTGQQRGSFGSIKIADHASKANLVPAELERHRLGAQPVATAGIDARGPREPRRDGPVILFRDADAGASYGKRPVGFKDGGRSGRQQARECRGVNGGKRGRRRV